MTELEQARQVYGNTVAHLSDSELQSYLSKIQFIVDMLIDNFERKIFDGQTIHELIGKI